MTLQEFVRLHKAFASAHNTIASLVERHINGDMTMDEVQERLSDLGDEVRLGAPYGQLQYEVYSRAMSDLGSVK